MVKIKLPRERDRSGRRRKSQPGGPRTGQQAGQRGGQRDGQRPGEAPSGAAAADRWLYGLHAVAAALRNPERRADRLLATANAAERLKKDCPQARPEIVERTAIDTLLPPGAVHQGVALLASPLPARAIEDLLGEDLLADETGDALLVALDQVTDPQNVGAILRSAAAFGARAVIVPRNHAPPVTGALAKAASGALEHVPLIEVGNLERALRQLKQAGFWCIGLDGSASQRIDASLPGNRLVLVMGAEGSGLRRLTAERCDLLVRLPTQGPIATLNVSNAAAVALYEMARNREDGR
jgi:23S rRNA (guanosine2251-2'-O)-methyltransferase